jgi:hypothetical protein
MAGLSWHVGHAAPKSARGLAQSKTLARVAGPWEMRSFLEHRGSTVHLQTRV